MISKNKDRCYELSTYAWQYTKWTKCFDLFFDAIEEQDGFWFGDTIEDVFLSIAL